MRATCCRFETRAGRGASRYSLFGALASLASPSPDSVDGPPLPFIGNSEFLLKAKRSSAISESSSDDQLRRFAILRVKIAGGDEGSTISAIDCELCTAPSSVRSLPRDGHQAAAVLFAKRRPRVWIVRRVLVW